MVPQTGPSQAPVTPVDPPSFDCNGCTEMTSGPNLPGPLGWLQGPLAGALSAGEELLKDLQALLRYLRLIWPWRPVQHERPSHRIPGAMTNLRFTVGSAPDRDDLVADLIADDVIWAQIHQENGPMELEIYANPAGVPWTLPLSDVQQVLGAAAERLRQLRRDPSTG